MSAFLKRANVMDNCAFVLKLLNGQGKKGRCLELMNSFKRGTFIAVLKDKVRFRN